METAPDVTTSRDQQREETRERLYLAALHVFRRDGVATCRVGDISQLAEVSRAAFYFHFPSKEDVICRLLESCEAPMVAELSKQSPDASLQESLSVVVKHLEQFWRLDENLVLDSMDVDRRFRTEETPLRQALRQRFARAIEQGELRSLASASMLCELFMSSYRTMLSLWARNPEQQSLMQVLSASTSVFMHGATGVRH